MEIRELKSELLPVLENLVKSIYAWSKRSDLNLKNDVGFGKYILISKLENHFSIEILGFQNITSTPDFVIEDKPNNCEINFFINGGKNFDNYNGLKCIVDGSNAHNYDTKYHFQDLYTSVVKVEDTVDVLFDDISVYRSGIIKEDCDLPFHFLPNSTNIFLSNVAIVSQVDGVFSFRQHAITIIVNKEIKNSQFRNLLNKIFDSSQLDSLNVPVGVKFKSQIISELKSLAYHRVDETSIDKFIQLISDDFATALGYKSAKSNIKLEIQDSSKSDTDKLYLLPDYLMEKDDGTYDILDLKLGLLSADFAFGDWTNSYFSSYAQKLLGQLAGYRRYFSNQENSIWAYQNHGIKINQPKLIGVAGNHNNFNREIVNLALEGNIKDFHLITYNELIALLKK